MLRMRNEIRRTNGMIVFRKNQGAFRRIERSEKSEVLWEHAQNITVTGTLASKYQSKQDCLENQQHVL